MIDLRMMLAFSREREENSIRGQKVESQTIDRVPMKTV
jgi:hypothetical protein